MAQPQAYRTGADQQAACGPLVQTANEMQTCHDDRSEQWQQGQRAIAAHLKDAIIANRHMASADSRL
jgi:hypothetical protein